MAKKKIEILIIFPVDPSGIKIGGIETCIKNLIKYMPDNFILGLVGVSTDRKKRPIGKWQKLRSDHKEFNFLPVLYIKDENKKTRIPLVIHFIFSLLKYKQKIPLKGKILEFHRIEPCLLFRNQINKKVLFIHGNTDDLYNPKNEVKWSMFPSVYFKLEKFLIRKINKINIVSESGVSSCKQRYPALQERISFMPTWVDKDIFYPYSANHKLLEKHKYLNSLNYPTDSALFLSAGRLERSKDTILLLEVFKYLNKKMPRSRLIIAGTGSLEDSILKLIGDHKLQKMVHLTGALDQKTLSNIMRICDVFLLTSAFEGMPRSVLEALACGLPVVTTNAGEVNKIVRNNFSGFISENRDPKTIGDLAIKILRHRENFKAENCVDSIRDYAAEVIISKIYSDYQKLYEN